MKAENLFSTLRSKSYEGTSRASRGVAPYGDAAPSVATARISKVLNKYNAEKYSRQILLPEIGMAGQERLNKATAAVVGVGALGTVAAELLVRAGVGSVMLIDRDVVEESNLQRQMLFVEKDVGRSKAVAAQEQLQKINSEVQIVMHAIHLNAEKVAVLKDADIVLDCSDNVQARFLLNDFCRKNKIPWIYAAAIKTSGYVMPILPSGPCLRCFLQEGSGETCDTVGVLNTNTTMIAALQATLALRLLLGEKVESRLYHYNVWTQDAKMLTVKRNKECATCRGEYRYLTPRQETRPVQFCSTGRYQVSGKRLDIPLLRQRWEKVGVVEEDNGVLHFKNILLFPDGRALIKAKSEQEALAAYSKWVGD